MNVSNCVTKLILDRLKLRIRALQIRFSATADYCRKYTDIDSLLDDVKIFLTNREQQYLSPPRAAQAPVTPLILNNFHVQWFNQEAHMV